MTILYISYDGAADNLGQSQIIPYISGLSKKDNLEFVLLTFEKKRIKKEEKNAILKDLETQFSGGICPEWFYLYYHKRPRLPATFFDIVVGFLYSVYITIKYKINIIHARATHGALIGLIPAKLLGKKFFLRF